MFKMAENYSNFKNKKIILVYHEGDAIKTCKGTLKSFNDEFLEIINNSKTILFNKKHVVSVAKE